jgi:hypothetical protein
MDAHPPPSAGTGAVNLRGEVAIYLSRQPEVPTALVVDGRLVRVLAGGRVLGEAEYTDRILEAIGKRSSAVVGELENDGREIRSAVVPVLKGRQ